MRGRLAASLVFYRTIKANAATNADDGDNNQMAVRLQTLIPGGYNWPYG